MIKNIKNKDPWLRNLGFEVHLKVKGIFFLFDISIKFKYGFKNSTLKYLAHNYLLK